MKEKKLLFAFAALILLTFGIGAGGIFQIQVLHRRVQHLARHYLPLEGAVLEMRIKNANYAMEIRSYVFWRVARYQSALPVTAYVQRIGEAERRFREQLERYQKNLQDERQQEWAEQAEGGLQDLFVLGRKIVASADREASVQISAATQDLLMAFEHRVYELDKFLDSVMGKSNLEAIQRQMDLAEADKGRTVFFLWISLAGALGLGGLIGTAVYEKRLQERAYRQRLLNRMMNVEEIERKKLSTAVHDEMGQDLSALKIHLDLIGQKLSESSASNPEAAVHAAAAKVEECRKLTSGLIEKSHHIAFLLRPPDLDEVGLVESLEALLIESHHLTGVEYRYEKPADFPVLSPEYSLLFYRISQEFLTNMAKHARAKRVELRLSRSAHQVELFYTDDGCGFEDEKVLNLPARRREDKLRLGLLGLKERVELLDGKMRIDSAPGRGTRITVLLPV